MDYRKVNSIYAELERRGVSQLNAEGFKGEDITVLWSADVRYEGHSYELNVPVSREHIPDPAEFDLVAQQFHVLHHRLYAYSAETEPLQVINLRVTVIGKNPPVCFKKDASTTTSPGAAEKFKRPVYSDGRALS